MSERDLSRSHRHSTSSTTHDADIEPGRRSRTQALNAPAHPIASGLIQLKARDANGVAEGAESALATAANTSGSALPDTIQRKFEASLGTDLSSVRVHTGNESATAAQAVGARAYTVGQDIHFGAGQYDPSSDAGQHLLAHEVAHTVQQRGGTPTRQNKLAVSSPHDAAEYEADRAADAMVSGVGATIANAPTTTSRLVYRDQDPTPAPTAATDEDKKFPVEWKFGYELLPAGGANTKGAVERKPGMAMYLDAFTVAPQGKPGAKAEVFPPAVNARANGDVSLGVRSLPDVGGKVSTSLRVGAPPTIKVDASVNVMEKPDKTTKKKLAGKEESNLMAVLSKKLREDTNGVIGDLKTDLTAEAKSHLSTKSTDTTQYELASLEVVAAEEKSTTRLSNVEARYPAPSKPSVYIAQFQVPEFETGSSSFKKTDELNEGQQKETNKTSEIDKEITSSDVREMSVQVTKTVEKAFAAAWESSRSSMDSTKGTFSKEVTWTFGGEVMGKLAGKIGDKIGLPLGALLKEEIPIPGIDALSLDVNAEITGELGGKLSGSYVNKKTSTVENSHTLTQEQKNKVDQSVKSSLSTQTSAKVTNTVATKCGAKFGFKESDVETKSRKVGTESLGVQKTFNTGHPTLKVIGGDG